jgi:hypothetical protein
MMRIEDDDLMKLNFDSGGRKWMMAKNMETARGPGNYPSLEVKYDHLGVFTFVVQNPDTVTFAAHNPFVPKIGKPNPPDFADQFEVSGAGTKMLVVKSLNANKAGGPYNGGTYHYELRFSDGSKLDPIITNNGCCRSVSDGGGGFLSFLSEPAGIAILLLSIAVIALVAMRMRRAG